MEEMIYTLLIIVTNSIVTIMFYKRMKLNFKKHLNEYVNYISKIETRLARPFEDFDPLGSAKEDWVVVTSSNREDKLVQTVQSIKAYEPDIKILVVDNGSNISTLNMLYELFQEKSIDKILLNQNADIPQWQKSFSMAQALKVLSLESIKSISWVDDDIKIYKPWIKDAEQIINQNRDHNIKIVNCMIDDLQEENHPTIKEIYFQDHKVKLKKSLNGAFFFTPVEFFKEAGMPPIAEGISSASVEDWYYSRQLQGRGWYAATIDCAVHLGYNESEREKLFNGKIKIR